VTGYIFSHWLVNGDNAGSSSSLSLKIDNPKKVLLYTILLPQSTNLTVTTTPEHDLKVKIDGAENPSPFAKSVDKDRARQYRQ
jgi:serine protease